MCHFYGPKKIFLYIFLLSLAALVLSGCGGGLTTTETGVTDTGTVLPTATTYVAPSSELSGMPAEPDQITPPATPSSLMPAEPSANIPAPESSTEETTDQPPLLSRMAGGMGLSFEDMTFGQIILAAATGSDARIYCYDKNEDGIWMLRHSYSGHLGQNGVTADKREGDKCTPAGLFKLGFAFGNDPKPETELEYRQVTEDVYWVDDPSSVYYNQWVEGTDQKDWNSAEHLSEYQNSYAYALVIEYNYYPDTVPGKGSAIFLHCGSRTYYGCIAVKEEDLLEILRWLSPQSEAHILIGEP